MFESLADKFSGIIGKLRFKQRLTERNVGEACEEVRVALLEADVHFAVAREFVGTVRQKALGVEVLQGVEPGQQFVKIVYDALVNLLGPTDATVHYLPKGATVILMAGLQGSGKTTTCAKLANLVKRRGRQPLLVAADVQRPAAIEQLRRMGELVDCPVYDEGVGDPVRICRNAVRAAEKTGRDTVILDTAGRLHVDDDLMRELEEVASATAPSEIFLVADSMTGQDAVNSAKEFNDRLEISGLILTKLDGDARGGAALSIKSVTGKPVKFVGVGEKTDALEEFHPDRMASRILGMGDVVSLVERAQQKIDQDEALRLQERLLSAQFTLDDMLGQFRQLRKMGSVKDTIAMLPGAAAMLGGTELDEREFARMEAILSSMTPTERAHPELLDGSRRARIARGSGTTAGDIAMVIKQYREMKKLFSGKGKLADMFSGMLGGMGIKLPFGKKAGGGLGGGVAAAAGPSRDKRKELREQRKKERRKQRRKR